MVAGLQVDMKKVTSQDVARRAGVSQSAVSRVFTPGASVSERMAAKVQRAAAELGYRPNILARSLITGNSRIIGVVVSYLNNQFYPEMLEILSASLRSRGYHPLMFMASNQDDFDEVMDEILDYQVDGIVMASVSMGSALAQRCQAAGIPVVLFNRNVSGNQFHSVTAANYLGGQQVAELLLERKHQRIAYVAGWEEASTQLERERGFVETLSGKGAKLFARAEGNFDFEQTVEAVRALLHEPERPDAIFFANDHMAFAGLGVIEKEFGLNVPDDISVVGFDDVPLASWPSFNLTTVRQPVHEMVNETVRLLLDLPDSQQDPVHIEIESPLVVRASVRE